MEADFPRFLLRMMLGRPPKGTLPRRPCLKRDKSFKYVAASISQLGIHVRAVNGRMAAGCPTRCQLQPRCMIHVADVNLPACRLHLCVAAQAEIRVALGQHLLIDRAVRDMADDAAFTHCLMFKHKRAGLIAMTLRAAFILPRHSEPACGFEDVIAMRVMALHTVHVAFDDRMMLWQVKFCVDVKMTQKARGWIFARVYDEAGTAAGLDVFTARTVAGFAARLASHCRIAGMNSSVRTGRKFSDNVLVAVCAGLVADKMCAGNLQRGYNDVWCRGT
jgi:hypothetical protein